MILAVVDLVGSGESCCMPPEYNTGAGAQVDRQLDGGQLRYALAFRRPKPPEFLRETFR